MSAFTMTDLKGRTLLEQIQELSSAEDFFLFFLLPYDEKIVRVNRLHILKRMGQYMAETDFTDMRDDDVFLQIRLFLKQAHQDFTESSPLKEKLFKVFKDQERAHEGRVVGLDQLTLAAE